jgi:3-oxoacyl-[acyl-carrier protein] reductase
MRQEERTTAIVTGSGRGIGRETAVLLARRGANVVVCSKTDSEVRSVVEEIEKLAYLLKSILLLDQQ